MDLNEAFAPLSPDEIAASSGPAARPGDKRRIVPIVPVPPDAPAPETWRHPKHGAPSRMWRYTDALDQLMFAVARFDFRDGDGKPAKAILPLSFCDIGRGRRAWRARGIDGPRPLYNLPAIAARPDATLIVAEGEKAADAAGLLFPDTVATTPAGGAKSPHKADWTPVAGRTVIVATDNDEAGRQFGDKVCELARAAGATAVLHLPPDRLGSWVWKGGGKQLRDDIIPAGWDIADAVEDGWTADAVAALRGDPAFLPPYAEERETSHDATDAGEPEEPARWPFRVVANGVEKRIERVDKQTGAVAVEWKWFCSRLEVEAETRSADGDEWGRLLRITDRDGRVKEWSMPMRELAGDGTTCRERLLSLGADLGNTRFAREALHEYISTARPDRKTRCVARAGWQNSFYIGLDETFEARPAGERFIFQHAGAIDHAYRRRGTVASWQEHVARYAVGNSRLALALSTAFAAPLLHPTGSESGGFHFRGKSSTGKTTALHVAGSAWGGGGIRGFLRTWRATSNGLESIAALHCDALLCLDDLGQVDGRDAGQISYMLANGQGKTRAGRSGEARPAAEWRLLFLSSGEIGLADKIAEDGRGRRIAAGQEVRIVDIAADAGAGLGIFENLHGFPSADAFARHLTTAAGEHYGEAWRAYMRLLVKGFDDIAPTVNDYRAEFMTENAPAGADGQVSRVAARFGLVAAGGEMATAFGVLPWEPGEATRAAARCFRDWLQLRGGVEPAEEREAVSAVRRFIELHGNSRFEPMGDLMARDAMGAPIDVRIQNRAGFRRRDEGGGIEYLVLPEAWRGEVCAGLDAVAVAKTLASRKLLITGEGNKLQKNTRLPGFSSSVRCYVVTSGILGDGDA